MAPRPVFEGAQAEFLSDRLADFCASQDEKDVSTFMAQTYTEFFETWPEDDEKKKKKLKNVRFILFDIPHGLTLYSSSANLYLVLQQSSRERDSWCDSEETGSGPQHN